MAAPQTGDGGKRVKRKHFLWLSWYYPSCTCRIGRHVYDSNAIRVVKQKETALHNWNVKYNVIKSTDLCSGWWCEQYTPKCTST